MAYKARFPPERGAGRRHLAHAHRRRLPADAARDRGRRGHDDAVGARRLAQPNSAPSFIAGPMSPRTFMPPRAERRHRVQPACEQLGEVVRRDRDRGVRLALAAHLRRRLAPVEIQGTGVAESKAITAFSPVDACAFSRSAASRSSIAMPIVLSGRSWRLCRRDGRPNPGYGRAPGRQGRAAPPARQTKRGIGPSCGVTSAPRSSHASST